MVGRLDTVSSVLPLGPLGNALVQYGNRRTEGGSLAFRYLVQDLVLTLTSSVSGKIIPTYSPVANSVRQGPAVFNANLALQLLNDRVRLVGWTYHYRPAGSLATAGTLVLGIDYNSDTTLDTLAKASRIQGAVTVSPWEKSTVVWRSQGLRDFDYVASNGYDFNPVTPASFFVYGEGLPNSTLIGHIYAVAILEYTGRQSVSA